MDADRNWIDVWRRADKRRRKEVVGSCKATGSLSARFDVFEFVFTAEMHMHDGTRSHEIGH